MPVPLRTLIQQNPLKSDERLAIPPPAGWRVRRDGETERQRADRVARSCYRCGTEFSNAGEELNAHEDRH